MNKIILINGSPKYNNSASEKYLELIYENLSKDYLIEEIDCNNFANSKYQMIKQADIIIFAFPLYVDALPSHVIDFISRFANQEIHSKKVYVLANCGYYEGIHNEVALDVIKNFCLKNDCTYMGGLGIGCGPIGFKNKFYNKKIHQQIKKLSAAINYQNYYDNYYIEASFPRFIYILIANLNWYYQIKLKKTN